MEGHRALAFVIATSLLLLCLIVFYVLQKPSINVPRQMETRPFTGLRRGKNSREQDSGQLYRTDDSDDEQGVRRPPDFIIIGARKCGTRALLSMINLHPRVVTAGPEVHYFDNYENYRKGLSWYVSKMRKSRKGQLTGEKSPKYFVAPHVPARIKDYSRMVQKDVKLLLVVRNPVDRVISDYAQGLDKREVNLSRTKKIREEFNRRAFDQRTGDVNSRWGAISVSQYSTHLSRWLEKFSLKQLHIVDGDKLIADPANEMKKVDSCFIPW
jgi:[heparan sulfate]-glucosamine 3-sulfotransferase 5